MKKVLLLTSCGCGGAERMTLLYAKILSSRGYDCNIAIWSNQGDDFELKPFLPLNIQNITYKGRFKYLFFKLFILIHKNKYDYVFSSLPSLSYIILRLKSLHLIPSSVIIRSCNMPSLFNKVTDKRIKQTYQYADALIAQTDEMKDEMISWYRLNEDKVIAINNPIDKDLITEKIKEKFAFDKDYVNYVAVSRISKQKDFATMLKAFSIVLGIHPRSRLYIVGGYKNDEVKQELDSIIEANAMTDSVFFEGFQTNPYKYMNGADVFCLSSVIEGLPNVMLEAMFLGKPVVVTRSIPFIKKTVRDGVNGYTVEVGDCADFAEKMLLAKQITNLPYMHDVTNSENNICKIFK